MKSLIITFRTLRLHFFLVLGLCLGNVVWSEPSIQSIEVSPNPLTTGEPFAIAVTASADVTRAIATVDFRTGNPRRLQIPLVQQGLTWTGAGLVPTDLRLQLPLQAGAMVKVSLFDAFSRRIESTVHLGVNIVSVSAFFAEGVLTVTGDEHNNTLVVSRDAAGTLLVNGGAVPVTGGVPTIANTTLIRILGLEANDVLRVDDGNGLLPPANLLGGEGDDTLTGSANIDELDGGPGDDVLAGRDGNDTLLGGSGNDTLSGDRGVDGHFGGEGDDELVWLPGDGSDLIEGEDGTDVLLFIGSNGNESVDVSPDGQRLRFFRNPGTITMDCDGVERVVFRALGGVDSVVVNDLTGTQVTEVLADLSSTLGTSDGEADTIVVNGTATNDVITVTGSTNGVAVLGLTAALTVLGGEPGRDELVINTLGGDDAVDASAVEAGSIDLTLNGGLGIDRLVGGQGNDLLIGAQGADVAFGGAGDDTFVWNQGDGSDVFEGQSGRDSLLFNGANGGEKVDISANSTNPQRLRFFRDLGNITMDCNEIELVQFNALDGADTVTVNDLSGTGVTNVNVSLTVALDSDLGDDDADSVIVMGTAGKDAVTISGTSAGVNVIGLSATVSIVGSEPALDQFLLRLLAGDDLMDASGLPAGVINVTADGGAGNDVLIGSAGADTLLGGDDDDVLNGGPGLDVLDGGPGNNILIQD